MWIWFGQSDCTYKHIILMIGSRVDRGEVTLGSDGGVDDSAMLALLGVMGWHW